MVRVRGVAWRGTNPAGRLGFTAPAFLLLSQRLKPLQFLSARRIGAYNDIIPSLLAGKNPYTA